MRKVKMFFAECGKDLTSEIESFLQQSNVGEVIDLSYTTTIIDEDRVEFSAILLYFDND